MGKVKYNPKNHHKVTGSISIMRKRQQYSGSGTTDRGDRADLLPVA